MNSNLSISIFLDTRRAKKNSKYPVKLRIFSNQPRKQKLYNTEFEFTKSEFASIWGTTKPRNEHKDIRRNLQKLENDASEMANKIKPFDFAIFENKLFGFVGDENDVFCHYQRKIQELIKSQRVGTAESYRLSMQSLKTYHAHKSNRKTNKLTFFDITASWLREYEVFMLETGRSQTTVGIYLRALRAIFNSAIEEQIITKDIYPFGKKKFNIPATKKVKKALTKEQLSLLFNGKPLIKEQQTAKDFWFFSYICNGMNFKDIANLKYKNVVGENLMFIRSKTSRTSNEQKNVTVFLMPFAKDVIEKYGNSLRIPENYIFSFIDHNASIEEQYKQLKNFIRLVNQHFLNFAKSVGIDEKISCIWARHSFATNAIRNGASMEYISEALSHTNLRTTQNYFAGFTDDKKKEIAQKLMEF
ncbi:MAG TPA: site-specific integrase [Prolixibacteraceae bacterium]|nr:site-specific integrase [Prolixibacteraceae bacterium]